MPAGGIAQVVRLAMAKQLPMKLKEAEKKINDLKEDIRTSLKNDGITMTDARLNNLIYLPELDVLQREYAGWSASSLAQLRKQELGVPNQSPQSMPSEPASQLKHQLELHTTLLIELGRSPKNAVEETSKFLRLA
jgi:hypothetical protein